MKAALLLIVLLMVGCTTGTDMSNEDIIEQTLKCEEAGLVAKAHTSVNGKILRIKCYPKEQPE